MDTEVVAEFASEVLVAQDLAGWEARFFWTSHVIAAASRNRRILWLSWPLVQINTEETVKNEILHEVAAVVAGPSASVFTRNSLAKQFGATRYRFHTTRFTGSDRSYCP